jgi:hypothetical protein
MSNSLLLLQEVALEETLFSSSLESSAEVIVVPTPAS